jgi:hypothetical protein
MHSSSIFLTIHQTPEVVQSKRFFMLDKIWEISLENFNKKQSSDLVQQMLASLGLIEYDPKWGLVGLGADPETCVEFLTFPLYSSWGILKGFFLFKEGRWIRTETYDKRASEVIVWGNRPDLPYTIVCSTMKDMSLFLSQNRDLFNIKFNMILPFPLHTFYKSRRLYTFLKPKKLIFLGRNPEFTKMLKLYAVKTHSRMLQKGASVSDFKAGNAFKPKCKFLTRKSCIY